MKRFTVLLLVFGALVLALPLAAQSRFNFLPTTPPLATAPLRGTFYSMQRQGVPPMPFNRFPALPVYEVVPGVYLVDDRSVDYTAQNAAMNLLLSVLSGGDGPLNGTEENDPPPAYDYGPGVLWLEITQGDTLVTNLLHGTVAGKTYELFNATNLSQPLWLPVELRQATNELTAFSPQPKASPAECYFQAALYAFPIIAVEAAGDATEPGPSGGRPAGQTGAFNIFCNVPPGTNLTLSYHLSGTAGGGQDYTIMPGTVTLQGGTDFLGTNIYINPTPDFLLEGDETVTLTIAPMRGYAVNPNQPSATITLHDNVFDVVAELPGKEPIGIGYHPPTQSLIVSVFLDPWLVGWAEPTNAFVQIYINATSPVALVTNWSDITGLADEVKLTIAQSTRNGFTNGQMFFGNGRSGWIGRLSADGASAETNWAHLPTTEHLRGSVCLDETGVWNGDLIAVTGDSVNLATDTRDVWRISANGISNLVAQIATPHLEGVTTLPNDPAWGPWAGKIITGDESMRRIFIVATNGTVSTIETTNLMADGIGPEDFDIIPFGQDYYCAESSGTILRIPKGVLVPFVGDLLIVEAGEVSPAPSASLYILSLKTGSPSTTRVSPPPNTAASLEHGAFAPIVLPPRGD